MTRILVIAAHADDEVLGLGGTIARHVRDGDHVDVAFMTDGVGSREASSHHAHARAQASQDALHILGAHLIYSGTFPDNALDTVSLLELTKVLDDSRSRLNPTSSTLTTKAT